MDNNKKMLTGVKKRQQIKDANQLTFIWIIVASAAVVFCLVTAQFLIRQMIFNQKVINERANTQSALAHNIKTYDELKKSVESLVSNPNLSKVKADESDSAYKVVLDALPVTDDGTVLASSLMQSILPKSGVNINNLKAGADTSAGASAASTDHTIPFNFSSTSNYSQTLTMLKDIERSIRPLSVTELSLQGSDSTLSVEVTGVSYYSPEKSLELTKKVVKP